MENLRAAAETAGTDARTMAKRRERFVFCSDQTIARVLAAANYREAKARRNFGGNIFHAVNRKIDFLVEKSLFKFLDEDAFAADLNERSRLQFVAGGFDDDEFALPFGKHAAAGADTNGFHG